MLREIVSSGALSHRGAQRTCVGALVKRPNRSLKREVSRMGRIASDDIRDETVVILVVPHVAVGFGQTEAVIVTTWFHQDGALVKTDGIFPSPLAASDACRNEIEFGIVRKGAPCELRFHPSLLVVFGDIEKMICLREMQFPGIGIYAAGVLQGDLG